MIYINNTDPKNIWVASDEDPIGRETSFSDKVPEEEAILISVADFLGFDPDKVLTTEVRHGV